MRNASLSLQALIIGLGLLSLSCAGVEESASGLKFGDEIGPIPDGEEAPKPKAPEIVRLIFAKLPQNLTFINFNGMSAIKNVELGSGGVNDRWPAENDIPRCASNNDECMGYFAVGSSVTFKVDQEVQTSDNRKFAFSGPWTCTNWGTKQKVVLGNTNPLQFTVGAELRDCGAEFKEIVTEVAQQPGNTPNTPAANTPAANTPAANNTANNNTAANNNANNTQPQPVQIKFPTLPQGDPFAANKETNYWYWVQEQVNKGLMTQAEANQMMYGNR